MVISVDSEAPAAKAGILQGDVIIAVNGSEIEGVRSLLRALGPDSIGSSAELLIVRAGVNSKVSVLIGERAQG
jgi:S1-C subfamily serine protease